MNMTRSSGRAKAAPNPAASLSPSTQTQVDVVTKPDPGTYSPCTKVVTPPSLGYYRPIVPRANWIPVSETGSSSEVLFSAKLLHFGVYQ